MSEPKRYTINPHNSGGYTLKPTTLRGDDIVMHADDYDREYEPCVWTPGEYETNPWMWYSACGHEEEAPEYDIDNPKAWDFCPYCGARIVIKEESHVSER